MKEEIEEFLKTKGLAPHDLLGFVIPKQDIREYMEMTEDVVDKKLLHDLLAELFNHLENRDDEVGSNMIEEILNLLK